MGIVVFLIKRSDAPEQALLSTGQKSWWETPKWYGNPL
jgi:hypothetical protein